MRAAYRKVGFMNTADELPVAIDSGTIGLNYLCSLRPQEIPQPTVNRNRINTKVTDDMPYLSNPRRQ